MGTVRDLHEQQAKKQRERGGHGRRSDGDEGTDADQKLQAEREAAERKAEEKRLEEAAAQLELPIGGKRATALLLQITGPAVSVDPAKAGSLQRDQELEVTVRGWIKTGKTTTSKRRGPAHREMVLVVDSIDEDSIKAIDLGEPDEGGGEAA